MAVAVHVALGVGLLTWPWAGLVADTVLAVVVVTLVATKIVAMTIFGLHRRRSHTAKEDAPPT